MADYKTTVTKTPEGTRTTSGNMTDEQVELMRSERERSSKLPDAERPQAAFDSMDTEIAARNRFKEMREILAAGGHKEYTDEQKEAFLTEYKKIKAAYSLAEGGAVSMKEQMRMFEDGGLLDEGGTVDPVSGNDVPPGSTQEEVRDDIPAQLSEGEFVFPADVVRFIGLGTLMRIRQEAKMGLKQMDAMGQMGNSDEATMPDDLPFDLNDLDIEDEDEYNGRQEFAVGGTPTPNPDTGVYYTPSAGQGTTGVTAPQPVQAASSTYKAPQQYTPPTLTTPTPDASTFFLPPEGMAPETREYINAKTGEKKIITFVNGQPTTEIPEGFVPASEYVKPEKVTTESTRTPTTSVLGDGQDTSDDPRMSSTSARVAALTALDKVNNPTTKGPTTFQAAVAKVNKENPVGGFKSIPKAVVDGIKRKSEMDKVIDSFDIKTAADSAGLSVEDYQSVIDTMTNEIQSGYRDTDGNITAESVAKGPKDVSGNLVTSPTTYDKDAIGDESYGDEDPDTAVSTSPNESYDDAPGEFDGLDDDMYSKGGSVTKQMKRSGLASK